MQSIEKSCINPIIAIIFVTLHPDTPHNKTIKELNENDIVSEEVLEGLGISRPAYEEIQTIIGRLPSVDELSTLLAMWQSQGGGQGLLSWLKGQPHSIERHDYIESDNEPQSKEFREPRVRECIDIARSLFGGQLPPVPEQAAFAHRGDAIYMVGDVSELFVDSDYGRKYLHIVDNPVSLADDSETEGYLTLILESLQSNGTLFGYCRIGAGGLFGTLLRCAAPSRMGFDILTCREVRLDAFLFGERGVRYITTLDEPHEDFFLQKLSEARVNCCFLGRSTKGRVLVDGMDFGSIQRFAQ